MYIFNFNLQIFFSKSSISSCPAHPLLLHKSVNPLNYLAHAFLSPNHPAIQIGNLWGDFIKANQRHQFSEDIQQGILLHRSIDQYTDQHPLVLEALTYFRPQFILSGGVFLDILFDHFLANDERYFNDHSLQIFTNEVYQNLEQHQHLMNEKMAHFFHYMAEYNWLYHYKFMEGLQRSIQGICKRYPRLGDANSALEIINLHFSTLQELFYHFFPDLQHHVQQKFPEHFRPFEL